MLESQDAPQQLGDGQEVTSTAQPGVLGGRRGRARRLLRYFQGEHLVVVQVWEGIDLTDDQIVELAEGDHRHRRGRGRRRLSRRPASVLDEGHEQVAPVLLDHRALRRESTTRMHDAADRRHQDPADRQLLEKRRRHGGGRG